MVIIQTEFEVYKNCICKKLCFQVKYTHHSPQSLCANIAAKTARFAFTALMIFIYAANRSLALLFHSMQKTSEKAEVSAF